MAKNASPELQRLQRAVNSLVLRPLRRARREAGFCAFCTHSIAAGQEYRDGGKGRRAHQDCVTAVSREVNRG